MRFWLQESARYASDDARIVLCANKTDMASQRAVDSDAVTKLAEDLQLPVFEVSAKGAVHIEDVFSTAALQYLNEKYVSCPSNDLILRH